MKIKRIFFLVTLIFTLSIGSFAEPINFRASDQNSVIHNFSDYHGKYVILVFWANWCPPCRTELPHIEKLYKKYGENKKDIVFLGINDGGKKEVKKFIDKRNLTFPTLIDEGRELPVGAYPTLVVLNKNGEVLTSVVGAIPEETLVQFIDKNLLSK